MDVNERVLRTVFAKFDEDKTGYLNKQQFTRFLIKLSKYNPTVAIESDNINALFLLFDSDHDDKLSYDDFSRWWNSGTLRVPAELLSKAYSLYIDHSSQIRQGGRGMNINQFEEMMGRLRLRYQEEMFDQIDSNEDGLLTFDEFVKWLKWF